MRPSHANGDRYDAVAETSGLGCALLNAPIPEVLMSSIRIRLVSVSTFLVVACGGSDGPAAPAPPQFEERIVFEAARDGNRQIYTMGTDGSRPARLTVTTTDESNPAWSPDGKRIAFHSNRDGNTEIYVMNA